MLPLQTTTSSCLRISRVWTWLVWAMNAPLKTSCSCTSYSSVSPMSQLGCGNRRRKLCMKSMSCGSVVFTYSVLIVCLTYLQFSQLFQTFAVHLKTLSELRNNLMLAMRTSNVQLDALTMRSLSLLSRHILTMGKFFRRLQQIHVAQFVALPSCNDLVFYYWDKVVQANASPSLIDGMAMGLRFDIYLNRTNEQCRFS